MRLLDTDESYEARKFKSSDKHSIFAKNKVHGDMRGERFLGIAPTKADADLCIEYLYTALDALVNANTILRRTNHLMPRRK